VGYSYDSQDKFSVNVAQHRTFETGLQAAWLYLRLCRDGLSPKPSPSPVPQPPEEVKSIDLAQFGLSPEGGFSPINFRKHLDIILPSVYEHLYEEIQTLSDPIYLDKVGDVAHNEIDAKVKAHLRGYDPAWHLCAAFGTCYPETDHGNLT
jgi:hypothetical protein